MTNNLQSKNKFVMFFFDINPEFSTKILTAFPIKILNICVVSIMLSACGEDEFGNRLPSISPDVTNTAN